MSDIKDRFEEGLWTIKALTGLSQADFDLLKKVAPQARRWRNEIVQVFYDVLYEHPRTAAVFHTGERAEREKTLIKWYLSLFEVDDETEFLRRQASIGFAHIRRRVNNQFMIGIAVRVGQLFQSKAIQTFGPTHGLEVSQAFERVMNAVVGLTAEGYDLISEVAFGESTGAEPELIDLLVQQSLADIERELLE